MLIPEECYSFDSGFGFEIAGYHHEGWHGRITASNSAAIMGGCSAYSTGFALAITCCSSSLYIDSQQHWEARIQAKEAQKRTLLERVGALEHELTAAWKGLVTLVEDLQEDRLEQEPRGHELYFSLPILILILCILLKLNGSEEIVYVFFVNVPSYTWACRAK